MHLPLEQKQVRYVYHTSTLVDNVRCPLVQVVQGSSSLEIEETLNCTSTLVDNVALLLGLPCVLWLH